LLFAGAGLRSAQNLRPPWPLGRAHSRSHYQYANWSVKRPWSKVDVEPMGTANVDGFLYRGTAIPGLYGRFVFGDFSSTIMQPSGQLFAATPTASWGALWTIGKLHQLDVRLHSLAEDGRGELYLLTTALGIPVGNTGKLWKLSVVESFGTCDLVFDGRIWLI